MLSQFLAPVINLLHTSSTILPLPWFSFIGAFIEELIAPIPSPLVMTLGGSLAASQGRDIFYLMILAFLGAIGKTIGSYLIYVIADRAEDVVLGKFGKFFGVSNKEVESIGKNLNKGWRDDVLIFLLRAIPIMPTAPVSLVAGLIKLNLRTYLLASFAGTFVRNMIYLYLGYTSLEALESINGGLDSLENIGYVVLLVLIGLVFLYIYRQRKKEQNLSWIHKALNRFKNLTSRE